MVLILACTLMLVSVPAGGAVVAQYPVDQLQRDYTAEMCGSFCKQ